VHVSVASPSQLAIALADHNRRRTFLTNRMMMIMGNVLRGDMSFKLAKKVLIEGQQFFECTYTSSNEFNEILGTWMCRNKSLNQVNILSILEKFLFFIIKKNFSLLKINQNLLLQINQNKVGAIY